MAQRMKRRIEDAIRLWLERWREKHPPRPFRVCLDEYREIMCERLTAEEYSAHMAEQRRIEEGMWRSRCSREFGPECV